MVLETVQMGGSYRRPQTTYAARGAMPQCWNAEAVSPYVSGIRFESKSPPRLEVTGIWWCPSDVPRTPQAVQDEINAWGLFSYSYSYFARVEKWPTMANRPQGLTENQLRSDRLLMNDELFHWHVNNSWTYSHGDKGPRSGDPQAGKLETGSPRNLAGLNQLFGDGRIAWKSGPSLNRSTLSPSDPTAGFVKAYSTDATFYQHSVEAGSPDSRLTTTSY